MNDEDYCSGRTFYREKCQRHLQRAFSLGPVGRGSWRAMLLWLMLSHVGTDVLDECVSSCQGALREYPSTPYHNF